MAPWVGVTKPFDVQSLYPKIIWFDECMGDTTENVIDLRTQIEGRVINMDTRNEVLELWYRRNRDEISKKYDELENETMSSNELVKKYTQLIERFEKDLQELYESEENERHYIKEISCENFYTHAINYDLLTREFREKYSEEHANDMRKLDKKRDEIYALLSLSNDLEYQLDVLRTYEIIEKKNKKIVS